MKTKQKIIELEQQMTTAKDIKERLEIQHAIEQLNALRNHRLASDFPVNEELHFDDRLKEFQMQGVSWMYYKYEQMSGCLLADEPGLGKTVEVLQFIQNVCEYPVLIVAPPTLCNQWIEMAQQWADEEDITVLKTCPCALSDVNVVSYDFISMHAKAFESTKFRILVADEIHYLKNEETRRYAGLLEIKADFRLGLSGTPIENSYEELYSILFFLRISTLPGKQTFYDTYVTPIKSARGNLNLEAIREGSTAARELQHLVSPIILRRRKAEVGMELPEKREQVVLIRLSACQEKQYLSVLNVRSRMVGKTAFGALIHLQKICDHPQLYDSKIIPSNSSKLCWIAKRISLIFGVDLGVVLDYPVEVGPATSEPADETSFVQEEETEFDDDIGNESNSEFDTSIDKLIIFSRSLRFEAIIAGVVRKLGLSMLIMSGESSQPERREIIHQFNTEKVQVLITSPRVGGIGLNLTAANNVIIAQPSWNPAVDTQASERTWRFGESRPVNIWRYASAGTVEERALEKEGIKQLLSDRILENAFESVRVRYGSVFAYVPPRREVTIRGYEEEEQVAIYDATTRKPQKRTEVDYERLAGHYLNRWPFKSDSFFPPPIDEILGKMMRLVDESKHAEIHMIKAELDAQLNNFSEYPEEIAHCYKIVFCTDDAGYITFQNHIMNI